MLAALLAMFASVLAPPPEAEGQRVFQRCYGCHSVNPRERGLPGPNLAGVVGREAGRDPGFDYSPAMRRAAASGLVWSEAVLDSFLRDPEAVVPRTEMTFVGVRDPRERQALIAYLKAQRGRR